MDLFHFPRWTNRIRPMIPLMAISGAIYMVGLVAFGASPDTLAVGYAPQQPISYSHRLHAGELGIDCRYCHQNVDNSAAASLPSTGTCMNCHASVRKDSPLLAVLRESATTGNPIPWVKVNDLPDHVFFNHSAHVTRGVGCVECHGRVDKMEVVEQTAPLSMGWCLDCHRNADEIMRPVDQVTNMAWTAPAGGVDRSTVREVNPPTSCSTCHR
ncbi:MAG: cytochrome c3 family protein [bacterium]|nr:cytochrome c3 family protein [bacterium]